MGGHRVIAPLLFAVCCTALPLDQFYPYGPNISQALPSDQEDFASPPVRLNVPINFYDTVYESIFVNTNGLLSFLTDISQFLNIQFPLGYPVIAPFYANVDTRGSGTVYYHESERSEDLQRAFERVRRSFSSATFQPTTVFVATWERVGYFSDGADKVNTFQVAVSSDGTQSFVELLYADDGIQWVQGSSSRHQGLPDARAQVGFVSGDGRHLELRGSGTDKVIYINKWSNVNEPGLYIFRVGPTENRDILQADLADNRPTWELSCQQDETVCHTRAACIERADGASCCACNSGFFGNGRQCLPKGVPFRVNGKVTGSVNDVNVSSIDLQSYVLVEDGRSYTAISRVPPQLGADLQLASPIALSIGWLFAKPAAVDAPNGFTLTGGVLNHSVEQFFPQSGERLSLTLRYLGLDVFDQLRVEVEIQGSVPSVPPDAKINMIEHDDFFTREGPGVLHASSRHAYTLDDSGLEQRFTTEQRVQFAECGGSTGSAKEDPGLKLRSSLSLISYEPKEGILRFAPNTKITNKLNETDPCDEGRRHCGPNSFCVPSGDSFECQCSRGYQKLYTEFTIQNSIEECVDIDECQLDSAPCSVNASCINTQGAYTCECFPGLQGDGYDCKPIIVQLTCAELGCDHNADCRDNRCYCLPGFEGDGFRCRQVPRDVEPVPYPRPEPVPYPRPEPVPYPRPGPQPDSYPDQPHPTPPVITSCVLPEDCSPNGVCTLDERSNLNSCVCLPGYIGDGVVCEPPDLRPEGCDEEGKGCTCPEGFTLDTDICLPTGGDPNSEITCDSVNNCHPHALCVYVPSLLAYKCVCNGGFSGDGFECSNNAGSCLELQDCHPLAECVLVEHDDRYDCRCRPGYRGDGRIQCAQEEPPGCEVTRNCHPDANCMPLGRRYECVCRAGFEGTGMQCQRVVPPGCELLDDCGRHAECLRLRGEPGYRCQCMPGFIGDGYSCEQERQRVWEQPRERLACGPVGNRLCTEKESDYMVIAQGMALMKVPLLPARTASETGQPLQIHYLQEAVGISVDCMDQKMYWSDVTTKTIKSAFYNGTNVTVFLDADIVSPEGVAVDWVSRNIYWADSSKDTIEVASLDTRGRTTIVRDGLVNPRGIAVHPQRGKLFWSDWDRLAPKLEWSNLDGSQREIFLQGNAVKLPNSLVIDFDRDELCWADAGTKSIECIGISSSIRRTVASNCSYPFGLTMSEDNYFWTDWQSHKVESVSRPEGIARPSKDVPLGGSGKMYGVTVIPDSCRRMSNPCGWQRGYCNPDQICLPDGQNNRRCVCPENETCIEE